MKRFLHARIANFCGSMCFWCSCEQCGHHWTSPLVVWKALTSLRRHAVDFHGGVDLAD